MSQGLSTRRALRIPHECADRMLVQPKDEDDGYNSGSALVAIFGYTGLGMLLAWLVIAWLVST